MEISIGDTLFGYPVVYLDENYVYVNVSGVQLVSFDRAQFTAGVLYVLSLVGLYIPQVP